VFLFLVVLKSLMYLTSFKVDLFKDHQTCFYLDRSLSIGPELSELKSHILSDRVMTQSRPNDTIFFLNFYKFNFSFNIIFNFILLQFLKFYVNLVFSIIITLLFIFQ